MTLLKYLLVIVAYEVLSMATGAAGSFSLIAFGVLDPDGSLAAYGTNLMLLRYLTTVLAALTIAWIAARYDATRET